MSNSKSDKGYALIELLIALAIGLFILAGVIAVYGVQTQAYKIVNSQASAQNSENAIAVLISPMIRGAGFAGCSTLANSLGSNLNPGGPAPLDVQPPTRMILGYDAVGTAGSGSLTFSQLNAANDSNASHWAPNLDATLVSQVETGSDVLVMFGASIGSAPVAVTNMSSGSTTLTVQDATGLSAGQLVSVSDCSKSTLFKVTRVSGLALDHVAAAGALNNSASALPVVFSNPVLIPMQQTAIYVAQGLGGQSVLTQSTYSSGTWSVTPLIPGVENMQVLYGTGSNGVVTQYVAAGSLTASTPVYAVRLAFLLEGVPGSAGSGNQTQFSLLGTTVVVPQDNRLRRVYEITVGLRNAS